MWKSLVACWLILLSFSVKAEVIKIGLFHHLNPKKVEVSITSGTYHLMVNDQKAHTFRAGTKLSVSHVNDILQLKSIPFEKNASTTIELIGVSSDCMMMVSPSNSKIKRKITGHISFWNRGKRMSMINTLDLDVYISGVIEAEAGSRQNEEYYKVQAVICRTYALSNKFKHASNGFHLCDEVHCQVYKGISESNPDIIKATLATSDVVVVDQDVSLITTAFHSNCGGHTINSEDVWTKAVPYLKAKKDTFCLDMPHSKWDRKVPKVNWMGFIQKNGKTASMDNISVLASDTRRTHYLESIHLKDIRKEFDFWSTLFTVKENQVGTLDISGRGFGHGVGLCQEGAMKMSTLGYDYITILHYYFTDIHVVPLSNFHLFQEN